MCSPSCLLPLEIIPLDYEDHQHAFAIAVRDGLTHRPKQLPCRFIYDERGSQLFESICNLPEYYPTRTEAALLAAHAHEIVAHLPDDSILAELGSGSSTKTRHLIEAFLARQQDLLYLPVDISPSILEESSQALIDDFTGLAITAVAAEYDEGLRFLHELHRPKLIAWLGGNVGNLTHAEAIRFLRRTRTCVSTEDRLLMGVDLRKSTELLIRAYDDSAGVTAAFNANLLVRMNRELGADFDLDSFVHEARYNRGKGRIEMHLRSTRDQTVHIAHIGTTVKFARNETIHTENSHKYTLRQIDKLAARGGFAIAQRWVDSRNYFSLNLLAPRP